MRPIVLVATVSLCLWGGIVWGGLAMTNVVAPSFIPQAQKTLQTTLAKAERHVRNRIALLKAKGWIPA